MRNLTWVIAPLALGLAVSGCSAEEPAAGRERSPGSSDTGPQATRDYALSDFTAVSVTGPDDVRIATGDAFSVRATGPQAELDELEIESDGDRLSIGRKKSSFFGSRDREGVKIMIIMPRLAGLRLMGSGEVEADAMEGDAVEAVLTGSGDLKVAKLNARSLSVAIAGSGDIKVDGGSTESGEYRIAGSGNIKAEGLAARSLDVAITGSGDVKARATGSAKVAVMGSGDVTIDGGAACSSRKLGSGDIRCS